MTVWCVQRVLLPPDLSSRFCQRLLHEKQDNSHVLSAVPNFSMQNCFYSWPGVQRPGHDYMVLHQSSCTLSGSFWIYAPLIALAHNSVGLLTSQSPQGSDKNVLHSRSKIWTANWQSLVDKAGLFHLSSYDQPLKSGSAITNHWLSRTGQ